MQLSSIFLVGALALSAAATPGFSRDDKDIDHLLAKHKYVAFCEKLVGRKYKRTVTTTIKKVKPTTIYKPGKKTTITKKKGYTTTTKPKFVAEHTTTKTTSVVTKTWGITWVDPTDCPVTPPPVDTDTDTESDGSGSDSGKSGSDKSGSDKSGSEKDKKVAISRRGYPDTPIHLKKWKLEQLKKACHRFLKPYGTTTKTTYTTKRWPVHIKYTPVVKYTIVPKKTFTSYNHKTYTTKVKTITRYTTTKVPKTLTKPCPKVPIVVKKVAA